MVGPPGAIKPGITHNVQPEPAAGIKAAPSVDMAPLPATPTPAKEKPESAEAGSKPENNPLAPVLKVEQAGNLVNLASEIIAAGVNPFLSRLPKPLQPNADTSDQTQQAAPPPAGDPLDSVKLLGIVYNPKTPIALVAITGAKYPSQVVKTGDLIALETGQALISRITQQSIDVQLMGNKKENRTMTIPDIVGYNALKANSTGSSQPGETPEPDLGGLMRNGARPTSPTYPTTGPTVKTPMGMSSQSGANAPPSPLSNLKKLSNSISGGSGTNSKSPDVVLTEP